jgi:hypothetical protein
MTTAQVFSNGQQLGAPAPPTAYGGSLSAEFDFSTTIDLAGDQPITLRLAKSAGLNVLSFSMVGGNAIAPLTSWATASAFPALFRPSENTDYVASVVVDATFTSAKLTVTAGGFVTFALTAPTTPGLFCAANASSVQWAS